MPRSLRYLRHRVGRPSARPTLRVRPCSSATGDAPNTTHLGLPSSSSSSCSGPSWSSSSGSTGPRTTTTTPLSSYPRRPTPSFSRSSAPKRVLHATGAPPRSLLSSAVSPRAASTVNLGRDGAPVRLEESVMWERPPILWTPPRRVPPPVKNRPQSAGHDRRHQPPSGEFHHTNGKGRRDYSWAAASAHGENLAYADRAPPSSSSRDDSAPPRPRAVRAPTAAGGLSRDDGGGVVGRLFVSSDDDAASPPRRRMLFGALASSPFDLESDTLESEEESHSSPVDHGREGAVSFAVAKNDAARTQAHRQEQQLRLEEEMLRDACADYAEMVETIVKIGRGAELGNVHRLLLEWYEPLVAAIAEERRQAHAGNKKSLDRRIYGPMLLQLPSEQLAVIGLHNALGLTLKSGAEGCRYSKMVHIIGDQIVAEIRLNKLKDYKAGQDAKAILQQQQSRNNNNKRRPEKSSSSVEEEQSEATQPRVSPRRKSFDLRALLRAKNVRAVNQKARKVLSESDGVDWPQTTKVKAAAFVLREVMKVAIDPETEEPCFSHSTEFLSKYKKVGIVRASEKLLAASRSNEDDLVERVAQPRYLPMHVPPAPWTSYDKGGFLRLRSVVMRTHGNHVQADAIRRADMPRVYDGLDALGRVPWKINREVLDLVTHAWAHKLPGIPDMPPFDDSPLPDMPEDAVPPSKVATSAVSSSATKDDDAAESEETDSEEARYAEAKAKADASRAAWRRRCQKIAKKNAENHSLRCDMVIKLGIADRYKEEDRFYFPYNLDFRGRAYPVPPNLNHLGSDVCRGLLAFADKKPLGPRGLFWLRVHLANLFGKSKQSLADREQFAIANEAKILDVADRPLDGERWWVEADEPWQAVATCLEIARAVRHPGGAASYETAFPVHADGSCNGLQHYAALGRDHDGGREVNLLPGDAPRDVYIGVCELVAAKVARDARAGAEDDGDDLVGGRKATTTATTTPTSESDDDYSFDSDSSSSSSDGGASSDRRERRSSRLRAAEERRRERTLDEVRRLAKDASGDAVFVAEGDDDEEDSLDDDDDDDLEESDDDAAARLKAKDATRESQQQAAAQRRHLARIVDGMINRKVVKQTVMTSVYGVTFVGAREQIGRRLYEKVEALLEAPDSEEKRRRIKALEALGVLDPVTHEIDDGQLYKASCYVAKLTLEVLAELFCSARHIMAWLADCARLIAIDGQPVSWITPLGLPVVQPYRRDANFSVKTVAQHVVLVDSSDKLPVSTPRQRAAFPPNFIHSLDSTHMLMTAVEMDRRGFTFTAVHDSYWTHPSDVDDMNYVLRHAFLDLYSQPILEDLRASFELRYPHLSFPPIPDRGNLDLAKVLDAEYFFS